MANKRSLKRVIHLVCEELFAEGVAVSLYGTETQRESAKSLLYSIIGMEDEFIRRVSHPEPGMKAETYFKDLREKFAAQVSDIVDQMNG